MVIMIMGFIISVQADDDHHQQTDIHQLPSLPPNMSPSPLSTHDHHQPLYSASSSTQDGSMFPGFSKIPEIAKIPGSKILSGKKTNFVFKQGSCMIACDAICPLHGLKLVACFSACNLFCQLQMHWVSSSPISISLSFTYLGLDIYEKEINPL